MPKHLASSLLRRCSVPRSLARWAPVAAITRAAVAITVAAAAKSLRRPAAKSMFLRRLRRRAVSMAAVMAAAMATVMVAAVMVAAVMVAAVIVAAVMVVGNLWIKSWLQ